MKDVQARGAWRYQVRDLMPIKAVLTAMQLCPMTDVSANQQLFIWGVICINIAFVIALIIITPTRIMQKFNDFGLRIRGMGVGGWFLCILLVGAFS
jgi:hypothetical protein